jgi:hypothetical protein
MRYTLRFEDPSHFKHGKRLKASRDQDRRKSIKKPKSQKSDYLVLDNGVSGFPTIDRI